MRARRKSLPWPRPRSRAAPKNPRISSSNSSWKCCHPPPKADVLFVLDLTGSMQFAINGVRDGITSFAKQLEEQKIDARIGMLGYRDIEDDKARLESPPFVVFLNGKIISMNSREDFDRLLEKMKAGNTDIFTKAKDHKKFGQTGRQAKEGGGGDIPESTNQAMIYAAKQGFRPDASKVSCSLPMRPPSCAISNWTPKRCLKRSKR